MTHTPTTPLCFVDVETDGLHHGRRAWEIAIIRRDQHGERVRHFFVALDLRHSDLKGLDIGGFWDRHPVGRKLSGKPAMPGPSVLCKHDAAREVMEWTFGANLVGVNPAFDADTLAGLLRAEGYLPAWHYHLLDVLAMAVGFLRGGGRTGAAFQPPWRSDELSRACGVEPPAKDDRHTALGDAGWVARWYDAMTSGTVLEEVASDA